MRRFICLVGVMALGISACGDDDDKVAGPDDADLRIRLTTQEWHDTEDNSLTFASDGTWKKISEFGRTVDRGSWTLEDGELALTSWEDDSVTAGPVSVAEGRLTWNTDERGTIYWYDEEQ